MNKRTYFTLKLMLILLIMWTHPTLAQEVGIGTFEEAPCPFDVPKGLVEGESIIFGYVTVPEHHAEPEGPAIRLAVAIFPSHSDNPVPDPLVLNAGGPGECNMESFVPNLDGEIGNLLLAQRDAIVIEQRGTLYSEPNLLCKEIFELQITILEQNLSAEENITLLLKAIRACHDRLVGEGINLAAFNSIESAADIAMVMTVLGYDKFNLFGNSAGTILAQHVMRDYPERLRSVILSSPVPLGTPLLQSMLANATETLRRVFERCAADKACQDAYPNLEADFLNLLERLNANPVTVPIQSPATGKTFKLLLNGERLGQWLFMVMYRVDMPPQLPFVLSRILAGDYTPLQETAEIFFPMHTFSHGLQYSVFCSEFVDFTPEDVRIEGPYSTFLKGASSTFFGAKLMPRAREIWNVPALYAYAKETVTSDVPTLILCGEFDHVCPPLYGEIVAQGLTQAYVYTFPGFAHSPIDSGPCALLMTAEFLEDPTTAPDSSCLGEMELRFITVPLVKSSEK